MKRPSFSGRSQLIRYIDGLHRQRDNRPAVAAFLPDPPSENPKNDHLSVNSLEVESMKEIVDYHRLRQGDNSPVAICVHRVLEYSESARKAGVDVSFDRSLGKWVFNEPAVSEAYRHRPVAPYGVHKNGSPSHCGVEFSRALKDEHTQMKFARRMTAQKFHKR